MRSTGGLRLSLFLAVAVPACGDGAIVSVPLGGGGVARSEALQRLGGAEGGASDDAWCAGHWSLPSTEPGRYSARPECNLAALTPMATRPRYGTCRRPEFGLESMQTMSTEPFGRNTSFQGRWDCNRCDQWAAREFRGVLDQCVDFWSPRAREMYGPEAYAICRDAYTTECAFGGVRTFFVIRVRATLIGPRYHQRADDPACGPDGSGVTIAYPVGTAVPAECRELADRLAAHGGAGAIGPLPAWDQLSRREVVERLRKAGIEADPICVTPTPPGPATTS